MSRKKDKSAEKTSIRGIKNWPEDDRPRERLLRRGPGALSDAQLLAILLRTGRRGSSAFEMACDLLKELEGVGGLSRAGPSDLVRLNGLGPAKAAQVLAAMELGRRVLSRPLRPGSRIRSSRDLVDHYQPFLSEYKKEVFTLVMCDAKNRILRDETVSTGSLSLSIVHPREVFRPAVREAAASVFFLHNHPSGDPTPSPEDRDLTRRLVDAG
ncbi:MAG TPA: DNA repair protein RadC, partial [Nitrospiria bacterium]|nr:DNA repair protein RadC [Nitrospiria bacterium]